MFPFEKGDLFDAACFTSVVDDSLLRVRPQGIEERMGTVDEKIIEGRRCADREPGTDRDHAAGDRREVRTDGAVEPELIIVRVDVAVACTNRFVVRDFPQIRPDGHERSGDRRGGVANVREDLVPVIRLKGADVEATSQSMFSGFLAAV